MEPQLCFTVYLCIFLFVAQFCWLVSDNSMDALASNLPGIKVVSGDGEKLESICLTWPPACVSQSAEEKEMLLGFSLATQWEIFRPM